MESNPHQYMSWLRAKKTEQSWLRAKSTQQSNICEQHDNIVQFSKGLIQAVPSLCHDML